jgi:drug/metabolite transporter (DMT)-like permease
VPEATARPSALRLAAGLGAVYLVWGSTYLAIRFAIESLPPFLMAGARFVVAGAILYAWSRATGAPRPSLRHWRSTALVGACLLLGGNGGVVWAEQRVESGLAALLITVVPLWMVLIDWLRPGGRRPGWRVAAGLLLGFAGVALLVRPGATGGRIDPLGAAVLLGAAFSWAWGSLASKRLPLPASPLLTTGMEMLAGGGMLLLAALLAGEPAAFDPAAVTGRSLLALGYLVVFGSFVGFTAYVWLLRVAPPALVGTYAYVNPVVAVLLGWAFAGEPLTGRTLLAAAVIVTGVAVITTARCEPAPAAELPAPVKLQRAHPASGRPRRANRAMLPSAAAESGPWSHGRSSSRRN